jgi:transcriptional regulator with XRE-family HTH domain
MIQKKQILIRFGKNIRAERIKLDISQEQLGEMARVHRTYIGMLERAEKNVTLTNIEKIAKALGVRPGHLID